MQEPLLVLCVTNKEVPMVDFIIAIVAGIVELILDLCLENVHWRPKRKGKAAEANKCETMEVG